MLLAVALELANIEAGIESEEDDELILHLAGMYKAMRDMYVRNPGKPLKIAMFINGGLNSYKTSVERAESLIQVMKEDEHFPVFVIWDSAAINSYRDHLFKVRHGKRSKSAPVTSPIFFLFDALKTVANIPEAYIVQGTHSVREREKIRERKTTNELNDQPPCALTYAKTPAQIKIVPDDSDCRNTARAVREWVPGIFGKIITTPVAHSLGQPAWRIMQRRADQLVFPAATFEDTQVEMYPHQHAAESVDDGTGEPPALEFIGEDYISHGIVSVFFDMLTTAPVFLCSADEDCMNACPAGEEELDSCRAYLQKITPQIILVGHSMGAIVVNNLVESYPLAPITDVVHIASADSIRNFQEAIIPYLRQGADAAAYLGFPRTGAYAIPRRFFSLMLHPDNEEQDEYVYNLVPSGSLLTYIDNMYEPTPTTLDRTSGNWNNIKHWIPFAPEDVGACMFFKVFGFEGPDVPTSHGDFDTAQFWKPEYWYDESVTDDGRPVCAASWRDIVIE